MRVAKAWIVARKEFLVFRARRSILYSVVVLPFAIAIGLSVVTRFAGRNGAGIPVSILPQLLDSFSFFFLVSAALLPTTLASYSLVGEKSTKSLEPLLATPTTDDEILLGKGIAAAVPPLLAIWGAMGLFMVVMDKVTEPKLGYDYFPNWTIGVIFLALVPLVCLMSTQVGVLVSSIVSDARAAQQLAALMILPFAGVYVLSEVGSIPITVDNLLIIAGVVAAVDVALFFASRATFRRDEILTRWR